MKELSKGCFTMGDSLYIDVPYLEGSINETGQSIIFITRQGTTIGSYNCVLFVQIVATILFTTNKKVISKIAFTGPEINAIHPVGQAFSVIYEKEKSQKGIVSIQTAEYEETTTNKSNFYIDEKEVSVHFSIGRQVSTGIQDTPLKLTSIMVFEFEPTEDYSFIFQLYNIAKCFIQYLCYRRNIVIDAVELSEMVDGKYHICAVSFRIYQG